MADALPPRGSWLPVLRAKHDPQPSRPEAIRQIIEATFRLMGDEGLDSPRK